MSVLARRRISGSPCHLHHEEAFDVLTTSSHQYPVLSIMVASFLMPPANQQEHCCARPGYILGICCCILRLVKVIFLVVVLVKVNKGYINVFAL